MVHMTSETAKLFRRHGMALQPKARRLVEASGVDLHRLVKLVSNSNPPSNIIGVEVLEPLLETLKQGQERKEGQVVAVHLVDAFSKDVHRYSCLHNAFIPLSEARHPLFGSAEAKLGLYKDRYAMIHQRLMRNDDFAPPSSHLPLKQSETHFLLQPISTVLSGDLGVSTCVLAMLRVVDSSRVILEDPSGTIEADLSDAGTTAGLFPSGSIVIIEGTLQERGNQSVYRVCSIGHPPAEPRSATLGTFPVLQASTDMMPQDHDHPVYVLAGVHLDESATCIALERFFRTIHDRIVKDGISCHVVLMGNFSRQRVGVGSVPASILSDFFADLASSLGAMGKLKTHCHLIVIPGPHDPCITEQLPYSALPQSYTRPLLSIFCHVQNTTNPCRLFVRDQEIMLFRSNLSFLLRQQCVANFKHGGHLPEHMVKTIMDQSHLCPTDLTVQPIVWNYDHFLHLYPLPQTVILAEEGDPFECEYTGSQCLNPGLFSESLSYLCHVPLRGTTSIATVDLEE